MRIPALRIVSVVSLIITACAATGINGKSGDPELQEIAGYKQWQRLKEEPIVVNQSNSLAG